MRVRGKFLLIALVCLLAAGGAYAQTTRGAIQGKVVDEGGQALPGVTVVLSSAVMIGTQTAISDSNGYFRFVLLPPGQYKAIFSLSGYQRVEQESIQVNIASKVDLDVTLRSAFTQEVVVTSETPLVDTTSTKVGVDLSEDFFLNLPVGRNYTSVANVTPGAQSDASGQTFYGSTGSENAYFIDGVNTTGVELGQQGKTLNFEFIQEVQVRTGGYGAEYGHNTGGMINVITKSGGNEFHGDVFGYYDDDSWQSDLKGAAIDGALSGTSHTTAYTRSDLGVDIGGYILKDKLWFFAAYDNVNNEDTLTSLEDFGNFVPGATFEGDNFKDKDTSDLFAGKLTWRMTASHSLSASIFGDPHEHDGVVGSLAGPSSEYLGIEETGGSDGALSYDGVFGENLVVSARFAKHHEKYRLAGGGNDLIGYPDQTNPLGDGTITWGWQREDGTLTGSGFGFYQNQDFGREQYNADVSYFVDDFFGQHEFKAGYEWMDIAVKNSNYNSGGQRIYRYACNPAVRYCGDNDEYQYYYRHRFFTNPGADPLNLAIGDVINPLSIDTPSDSQAMFIQDRWQISPNFTLNMGVRFGQQRLYNGDGDVHAKIDDNIAPRMGFVWDFLGNGKSKLFGHWGRFYETIPMDIVIRSFGGEVTAFIYNFSDDPNDVSGLPSGARPSRSSILGGGFSAVDPDLKGQFLNEYVIGAEYEVATDLSLGVKFIRRDLGRIIEDALTSEGDYFIGNPGSGLLTSTYDMGVYYVGVLPENGDFSDHEFLVPSAKRSFTGFELTLQKRFSNNFQFLASALISRLTGNYDGTFQASTGQLDPNLNSAYDYYDFMVNNDGYLSNDRRQQYKFDGVYRFDWGLTAGLSAYYRTGTPISAMGYSNWYANWEFYLSRRGAMGRTDSQYEADLHLGYPFKVMDNVEVNVMLDIFNLLDRQGETRRNQRYDLVEDYMPIYNDPATGLWTGNPLPPITSADVAGNPTLDPSDPLYRPSTNSAFNTSNAWQDPRSIRFGVRVSF